MIIRSIQTRQDKTVLHARRRAQCSGWILWTLDAYEARWSSIRQQPHKRHMVVTVIWCVGDRLIASRHHLSYHTVVGTKGSRMEHSWANSSQCPHGLVITWTSIWWRWWVGCSDFCIFFEFLFCSNGESCQITLKSHCKTFFSKIFSQFLRNRKCYKIGDFRLTFVTPCLAFDKWQVWHMTYT